MRASVTSVIVDDSGTARGVVMADGSKVMAKRGVISNAGAQGVCVWVGSTQLGVTWCVYACSSSRCSQYVHEARSAASSSPRERQGHQEQRRGERLEARHVAPLLLHRPQGEQQGAPAAFQQPMVRVYVWCVVVDEACLQAGAPAAIPENRWLPVGPDYDLDAMRKRVLEG